MGISQLADNWLASQEGICCMGIVSDFGVSIYPNAR
jgi:hypothetical protein